MTGYTIAAVDDEPGILSLLQSFLEHEGYKVLTATSTGDFLAMIRDHSVDAFLLDIEIRDDSGIDLCRNLRSMEAYKQTPILCITGKDDPEYLVRAFSVGADDFITKPINLLSLSSRLKVQLQKMDYFRKL